MNSCIKGTITGFLLSAAVCAAPATADTIDVLFNQVRISVNGVDRIQWDESITLADGTETPASILYNGTTYLPMRKLGELSGNKIYWNGDSSTAYMTGPQKDIEVITEKPDKNGNVWKYYTFSVYKKSEYADTKEKYLGIIDEKRGYERVYRLGNNINVQDDGIYFVKSEMDAPHVYGQEASLTKIRFNSDNNTQDGERILPMMNFAGAEILDDEYLYYETNVPGNASHNEIDVYNYKTGKRATFRGKTFGSLSMTNVEQTEKEIIFTFDDLNSWYQTGPESYAYYEGTVIYDKESNSFGEVLYKEVESKN